MAFVERWINHAEQLMRTKYGVERLSTGRGCSASRQHHASSETEQRRVDGHYPVQVLLRGVGNIGEVRTDSVSDTVTPGLDGKANLGGNAAPSRRLPRQESRS